MIRDESVLPRYHPNFCSLLRANTLVAGNGAARRSLLPIGGSAAPLRSELRHRTRRRMLSAQGNPSLRAGKNAYSLHQSVLYFSLS